LLVRYNIKSIKNSLNKKDLSNRTPTLWKYRELLPVENEDNVVSLNEGYTPIIKLENLGKMLGLKNLYLKDEGILPTGTFKARGATVGVSMAKELGIKTIVIPTVGNAGEAWSAYCAKAKIKLHVVMPCDALEINKKECLSMGAEVHLLDGLLSDPNTIVSHWAKEKKWCSAATLFEPYRIEGKKTMGFEIAEQFNWNLPDVIIHPCGGAVGIISIWKAFKELQELGWVNRIPTRIVAVQSTGCAPIVKAFEDGKSEAKFWHGAKSIAQGFLAPKPAGDYLCLDAIRQSNGTAISVSDEEIKVYIDLLAAEEGISACPEGVATICAIKRLKDKKWVKPKEKILLINTGSGMKYFHLLSMLKKPHKIGVEKAATL
jgi:threonine synthase